MQAMQQQGQVLLQIYASMDEAARFAHANLRELLLVAVRRLQQNHGIATNQIISHDTAAAFFANMTCEVAAQIDSDDKHELGLLCNAAQTLLTHRTLGTVKAAAEAGLDTVLEMAISIKDQFATACKSNPAVSAYEAELRRQLQQQPMGLTGTRGCAEKRRKTHMRGLLKAGPAQGDKEAVVAKLVQSLAAAEASVEAGAYPTIRSFAPATLEHFAQVTY